MCVSSYVSTKGSHPPCRSRRALPSAAGARVVRLAALRLYGIPAAASPSSRSSCQRQTLSRSASSSQVSARGCSPPPGARSAPPNNATLPSVTEAADTPARGLGPMPAPSTLDHSHVRVSSTNASLDIAPVWSAPPNTTILNLPSPAAAWSPRGDGAVPLVGCSTRVRAEGSQRSKESLQRCVWTSSVPSPRVQATCRLVGPPGMSASRSHASDARSSAHTSARIFPPVPAGRGSQPPKRSNSPPTMAAAEHRRGGGRERSSSGETGWTQAHSPPAYRPIS
mmetsp:Transcript_41823/g.103151  ORF Transcript_41823/g.103151 Transcript_41823/m.103151 type:complete len:281 (-) Transcript_41823:45-887(-)